MVRRRCTLELVVSPISCIPAPATERWCCGLSIDGIEEGCQHVVPSRHSTGRLESQELPSIGHDEAESVELQSLLVEPLRQAFWERSERRPPHRSNRWRRKIRYRGLPGVRRQVA